MHTYPPSLAHPLTSSSVFNVACGDQISLNEMVVMLREISGKDIEAVYGPERAGDVPATHADTQSLESWVNFKPQTSVEEGVRRFVEWYREFYEKVGVKG